MLIQIAMARLSPASTLLVAMQQNQMLSHEEDELIDSEKSELEKTDEDDGPVCTSSIILKSRKPALNAPNTLEL